MPHPVTNICFVRRSAAEGGLRESSIVRLALASRRQSAPSTSLEPSGGAAAPAPGPCRLASTKDLVHCHLDCLFVSLASELVSLRTATGHTELEVPPDLSLSLSCQFRRDGRAEPNVLEA